MRTLIAGFGNVLRGDDGFGVEVIRRLREREPWPGVELMDVGTAGLRLAQELLSPCDRLIIVDAMTRGGAAGTVYVERVESVPTPGEIDMHLAVPARALGVAQALGALPAEVYLVGCEPADVDELTTELTASVQAAVPAALGHIERLLAAERDGADPVAALQRRDEILQIMFWLHGEGLGPDVSAADIDRFIDDTTAVRATLQQLVEEGLAVEGPDGVSDERYRLTSLGQEEGRRRFMDEFAPYLARHAHGECGSADCDCHTGGGECRGV
jgi:hydrogenase maturation protease